MNCHWVAVDDVLGRQCVFWRASTWGCVNTPNWNNKLGSWDSLLVKLHVLPQFSLFAINALCFVSFYGLEVHFYDQVSSRFHQDLLIHSFFLLCFAIFTVVSSLLQGIAEEEALLWNPQQDIFVAYWWNIRRI